MTNTQTIGVPRRAELPHDEMSERALVAAILLDETQAWEEQVDELVRPSDFFTPQHRAVYAAELALARRGEPVTIPTVADELLQQDVIEEVDRLTGGTEPYLVSMTGEWMLSATGCSAWARIIRRHSQARELIEQGTRMVRDAYAGRVEDVVPLYERPEYQDLAI